MKLLVPLFFSAIASSCVSPFDKPAKTSGDTLLAPSSAAKASPGEAQKDVKAQAEWLGTYQTEWNRTSARSLSSAEVDQLPKIIEMHSATYPPDMHQLNKEATVLIDFVVDQDGTVLSAVPADINAQAFPFSASATVAVWSWKFHPALKDGKPVKVRMRVPIVFRLD